MKNFLLYPVIISIVLSFHISTTCDYDLKISDKMKNIIIIFLIAYNFLASFAISPGT